MTLSGSILTTTGRARLMVENRTAREKATSAGARRLGPKDREELDLLDQRDYTAVFEASPDAMLVIDAHGRIQDLNRQALAMFGYDRDEIEGSPVERLVPEASRDRHRSHRQRYSEAPRPRPMGQELELQALRKDGTSIPVEISLSPSTLASGEPHVICAVRDMSSWKRMRRLSGMMIAAAEQERKHLSRELHDEFLQSLVALKIRAKLLADEKDDEERERARQRMAGEIADTIRGVKRMIRGLLPPELDRLGLVVAIKTALCDIEEVYGFTVLPRFGRVDELDEAAALALYRIVQEAVMNAVRHAGVDEATVTLESTAEGVTATVRDEGRGFALPDLETLSGEDSIGLAGMRERAVHAGGRLDIQSGPGEGTTVRVTVPVRGGSE